MDLAETSLRRVLTLLEHDWVFDFMFPRDNQIEQLHYAVRDANASEIPLTVSLHIWTYSTLALQDKNCLDEQQRAFFIPSFSTGQISVSFEIFECVKTRKRVNGDTIYRAKTIRNEEHGMFLRTSEPSYGLTEVSFGLQKSPGLQERTYMVFKSSLFQGLIAKLKSGFNSDELQEAIVFSFSALENRHCQLCSSDNQFVCHCASKFYPKRHPNDHEIELKNLSSMSGEFDGSACIKRFSSGCMKFCGNYSSRTEITMTKDLTLRKMLSGWIMSNISKSTPMSLFRLGITNWDINWDRDANILNTKLTSAVETTEESSCMAKKYELNGLLDVEEGSFMQFVLSEKDTWNGCNNFFAMTNPSQTICLMNNSTQSSVTCTRGGSEDNNHQNEPFAQPTLSEYNRTLAPSLVSIGAIPESVSKTSSSSIDPSSTVFRYMTERQRRAEMQKSRNRKSAERSNKRKKKWIEEMKAEISSNKEKEKILRRQERQLRQETSALRKAVQEKREGCTG